MASSPSNSTSEPTVMEKFITDFFAKSVDVILESRSPYVSARNYNAEPFISSPSSSPSLNIRPRDKWFNLALGDRSAALDRFDPWRQSNLEPLVLDVVLDRREAVSDASFDSTGGIFVRNLSSRRDEFGRRNINEKLVERWIVQYESLSISQPGKESSYRGSKKGSRATFHSSEFQIMHKKAYRRMIVLLRSLYAVVRLLPAYKLFRDLNASRQMHSFILSHKISSFAEPFSREEDAEMSQHDFGPLDIYFGKLSISVAYLKTVEDVSSGPSTPISTEFIMDYVGSPLVDRLKKLPSLPTAGSAPSYASFSRQHSWSNDRGETPSFSPTPSPTYSDSQALDHNLNTYLPSRHHLPENYTSPCSITHVSFAAHAKNFNECRLSSPFSPSSSSSPFSPTHLHRVFWHSECDSISVPLPRQKGSDRGQNQGLSPSPYNKGKKQEWPSQVDTLGTQVNTISAPRTYSPENKLQLKMESVRLMEFQTGMVLPKIVSTGKDSAVHLTGLKTYSPPPMPSRSSTRLSFLDKFDNSDFICPFAEADVFTNSRRVESANSKDRDAENLRPRESMPIRRSPYAAIGVLVWMLRRAPPLRLNNSNTLRSMQVFKDEVSSQKTQLEKIDNNKEDGLDKFDNTLCLDITAADLFKSRTVAEAFKELQAYKNIRELILKNGGFRVAKSDLGDQSKVE